ncbi:MAG: hypothetical protein GOMPHAMPRED_004484 [Gomphillus americanus]|uniref:NAD dependent epimerase/dehydratase n=1 Tax=Gomphillus americanus TaxID=1940652 RepID=A0A8H3FQZ5_9LECA|nr:MAG: hypothetical protein GOMPHAMPRED_004484 [Gomphillus americanus]
MGNQVSKPQPGTQFRVIGAGLSRTGTASFSEALRILLNGPVYHGGTQITQGSEAEILSWMKLLSNFPAKSTEDKALTHDILRTRLKGYAAVTDAPGSGLVPELLETFPDALVICTVRDPEAWVKSLSAVATLTSRAILRVVLFPLSPMRYFVDYLHELARQWTYLYGEGDPVSLQTYNRHIEWLKETVPEDKLMFFDVRDGWEPLCDRLGLPIPDVPFPRINDGEAIDKLAKEIIIKGLTRWAMIFGTVIAGYVAWRIGK